MFWLTTALALAPQSPSVEKIYLRCQTPGTPTSSAKQIIDFYNLRKPESNRVPRDVGS